MNSPFPLQRHTFKLSECRDGWFLRWSMIVKFIVPVFVCFVCFVVPNLPRSGLQPSRVRSKNLATLSSAAARWIFDLTLVFKRIYAFRPPGGRRVRSSYFGFLRDQSLVARVGHTPISVRTQNISGGANSRTLTDSSPIASLTLRVSKRTRSSLTCDADPSLRGESELREAGVGLVRFEIWSLGIGALGSVFEPGCLRFDILSIDHFIYAPSFRVRQLGSWEISRWVLGSSGCVGENDCTEFGDNARNTDQDPVLVGSPCQCVPAAHTTEAANFRVNRPTKDGTCFMASAPRPAK